MRNRRFPEKNEKKIVSGYDILKRCVSVRGYYSEVRKGEMKPRFSKELEKESVQLQQREPPLAEAAALCVTTVMLMLFGLAVLYSTSFGIAGASYFMKQIMWGCVGMTGFGAALLLGYKRISDWSWILMLGICLLLIIALMFTPTNGARRWIKIPGVGNIQPSEYAKVVLSLFLAKWCADRVKMIEASPWKFFFISCLVCGPMMGLVFIGKDLGTTVLLMVVFFAMLYASGVRLLCLLPWPLIGIPAGYYLIKWFSPYRLARLTTFTDPELTQSGTGYQLWLSLLALGSGNWTGVGFAESRLKHKYLPEAHTDFILSIVGEELGYVWMCVVILAYVVFVTLAIAISTRARTRQGMLLAFGLTTFIAVQAIINIGVISGAWPTKGMPAPFISYGGSSLVSCLVATGLIISVALDAAYPDYHLGVAARIRETFNRWNPFHKK